MRWPAFFIGLAAIASCTAIPPENDAAKAETPSVPVAGAAETLPAPRPVTQPVPERPVEPVRSDFEFRRDFRQGAVIVARAPTGASGISLDGKELPLNDDGYFLMGFNRDAERMATLSWMSNGQQKNRILKVAQSNWKIERVNLSLPRGRKASQRRMRELGLINVARSQSNDSNGWQQEFIWPVEYWNIAGGRISGRFGSQRYYRGTPGGYHTGLDIAAPTGTRYVAPADGVVTLAAKNPFSREGYLLMVDHGRGLNSAFVHSSRLLVEKGDIVKQGQAIGLVGATGSATGPHLHWSMKWDAARVDPLLILPRR